MKKKGAYEFLKKVQLLGFVKDIQNINVIEEKIDSKLDSDIIRVLIIEDHLQIAESYALIFGMISKEDSKYKFELDLATSCEEAILMLKEDVLYNLILLDISLPPYPEESIYSGEDISLWIDKNLPVRPKIIINTSCYDTYRLYNLYKNVNPDGFLTKDEADSNLLFEAIIAVVESPPYYSNIILNMIRKNFSSKNILNDMDRRILYELSQGATTKDLIEYLPYGKTSIQIRKKKLFEFMDVKDNDLRALIEEAKNRGFL